MSLKSILNSELVSCGRDTSVREVATLMDDFDVGAVLVVEGGKPAGIITDRDIVVRCVVQGQDCARLPVSEVMTEPVETISLEAGVNDAITRMRDSRVRRLPVVDPNGDAVGLVSFDDLLGLLGHEILGLSAAAEPLQSKFKSDTAA